jgi:hypothetical protein
MRKSNIILKFGAIAIVIAFGFGMVRLWMLRFEAGDIYTPYSSLRSDPLGTRVLYESLEQLPGAAVRRNYKSLRKLTRSDGDTLFFLGIDSSTMPGELDMSTSQPADIENSSARAIYDFATSGGRVVISFTPSAGIGSIGFLKELFGDEDKDEPDTQPDTQPKTKPAEEQVEDLEGLQEDVPAFEPPEIVMSLSLGVEDVDSWSQLHDMPAEGSDEISSNWPDVPWHGSIYFDEFSVGWKVIYRRNNKPVIIERALGSGSIVICADTYFLSNEAMVSETTRNVQLLAWLASNKNIVFDETHLGIANSEGVVSMARQHGLTNLFFVLLLLAALYIWRSSVSFIPRDPEHAERFGGREISGKSSAVGLHNLLRRCIPVSNILNECLKHWSASAATKRPKQRDDQQKIRAVISAENNLPKKQKDPVKAYTTICRILAERKK